jgi:hypothetical protein
MKKQFIPPDGAADFFSSFEAVVFVSTFLLLRSTLNPWPTS